MGGNRLGGGEKGGRFEKLSSCFCTHLKAGAEERAHFQLVT